MKENEIQQQIRLSATRRGWRLFRNNVGAGMLENGNFIRWGLANDTIAINSQFKSGDLIGIRPVVITSAMVGSTIGQFISVEVKAKNWVFNKESKRDVAQANWATLITSLGGYAIVSKGEL